MITLYVVYTDRAPEIVADTLAAVQWSSKHAAKTILVVKPQQQESYANCGADFVYETAVGNGFQKYYGIWQAIHDGVTFDQVVCLDDDVLFCGRGADEKISQLLYSESAELLGVADRHYYGDSFLRLGGLFSTWRLPHENWDKPPATYTAHSAALALSNKLARDLFYRHLLVPPGYEKWSLPFGVYATWSCQLLMLQVALRGSMDRPWAPFYVNDGWGGAYNPPPHLLHPSVLVYWSPRRAVGHSEQEIRSWCRSIRETRA